MSSATEDPMVKDNHLGSVVIQALINDQKVSIVNTPLVIEIGSGRG